MPENRTTVIATILSCVAAVIAIPISLTVPEVRVKLGLDKPASTGNPPSVPPSSGPNTASVRREVDQALELGVKAYEEKRFLDAEKQYLKALALDPNEPRAHFYLGNLLKAQKRYSDAEQCFNQAIKLSPDYVDAINSLGLTYFALEQYDEAITQYLAAIRIKPDFVKPYVNLGIAYRIKN